MATGKADIASRATPATSSSPPRRPKPSLHDRVAQAVINGFDALPGRGKPQGRAWTVLAGLVAEFVPVSGEPQLRLLAMATGTRCIGVTAMLGGRGQVVHDCHAEVLCRRAFQRYLLAELGRGGGDLLEPGRPRPFPTWKLRSNVRLHFYVSALPCGECALVPISSIDGGSLARKWLRREQGEVAELCPILDRNRTGAPPSEGMPTDPQADGIGFHRGGVLRYKSGRSDTRPESRNFCFSCSEKLLRWNHTGYQGALLARLIEEPVLMSSIVIGGPLFEEGFVRQALFGRAQAASASSGPGFFHTLVPFHCSREALEGPQSDRAWTKVSTAGLSLAWSASSQAEGVHGTGEGNASVVDPRSISRGVEGFYDVIIGHSGQRQGLRCDRQGRRKPASSSDGTSEPADSWVSPLCKQIMAEDLLHVLRCSVLGSEEELSQWLCEGERLSAASEQRGSARADEELRPDEEPAAKRPRIVAEGSAASVPTVSATSYSWLKLAASSGSVYRHRRHQFHSREPFVHWRRKQTLEFNGATSGIDGFSCCCLPVASSGSSAAAQA